ncbi:hypothetical protein HJD18_13820 [Thermoleophilia bacterium SCSIO 60948]|nr:hypothetical protein HJD18_13820 [Thermoleophilia bacterium SCSIO 60948]
MSALVRDTELVGALDVIAAGADALDRSPRFPAEAFAALREAGATAPADPIAETLEATLERWALVRSAALADSSVGRILDGHLNGVERIALLAPEPLRSDLLARIAAGALVGVWGGDPPPGTREPAWIDRSGAVPVLRGAKDFCSGAGGVELALVLARGDAPGPPSIALVEATDAEIDRGVFAAHGMRASESHRVVFDGAPLLAVLGEPGEIARDPWFSGDAMRTAASWAGMADAAAAAAIEDLRSRRSEEPLSQLAAGRILAATETIDALLGHGARRLAGRAGGLRATSIAVRRGIAAEARSIIAEAERACGSQPFVVGGRLERVRRDLELFLLQHRLDPMLERTGAAALRQDAPR